MTDETNVSRGARSLRLSLAWFVVLYVGGVASLAILALMFRLLFLSAVR